MLSDDKLKIKIGILTNKLNAGLFDEVIISAKILLKKRSHQMVYNILSIAYQSLGKYEQSAKIMEEALKKNPNNPYFLNNMGISQHKLENYEEAEHHFKKGLEVAPRYINILNNIANLKKDLNLTNEAISFYKKSLLIKDDIIETQLNLATIYTTLGKFEEAEYHFKKILKINPKFTEADRLISAFTKYDENNEHLKTMINKLKDKSLNKEQLMHLHFALGKSLEDIKKYEESFNNYMRGNQYLNDIRQYDINKDIEEFEDIKNKMKYIENIEIKSNKRKIIFIVGMPRSGTSLAEQIISSHSKVFGGGELAFLTNTINKQILDNKEMNISKNDSLKKLLNMSQEEYISKISQMDPSEKSFTDKAPLNFKYIGFIKKIFPNSKIINCNRDPVDICWSNYKNFFSGGLPFSNNLDDLANFYSLYQNYIKYWRKYFSDDIYDLSYEKLVQNSEDEIKRLLNFCGLEWDQNCLKHENNMKSIKTASWAQARKPIYKSAINSSDYYKKYLNDLINKLKS